MTYRKLIVYWFIPVAVEMCDYRNKHTTCIQQSSAPRKITDLSKSDHSVHNLLTQRLIPRPLQLKLGLVLRCCQIYTAEGTAANQGGGKQ